MEGSEVGGDGDTFTAGTGFEPVAGFGEDGIPVEGFGAGPGALAEFLVAVVIGEEFDDFIGEGFGGFLLCKEAGLVIESGFAEAFHGVDDGGGSEGIGFDDVEAPAFADGGMEEEVGLLKDLVLFLFWQGSGEVEVIGDLELVGFLEEEGFHIAIADDSEVGIDISCEEGFEGLQRMVDAFIGGESGYNGQLEGGGEVFFGEFGEGLSVDAVADDADLLDTVGVESIAGGFACGPEVDVAVELVGPAFLELADIAPGTFVEGFPDGAEDFVDVGDAVGFAPPGGEPGDTVVLVDDEIELGLGGVPTSGFEDGGAYAAAADELDGAVFFLLCGAGELVGEPEDLMAALGESGEVAFGDPFSAAGAGVMGVPPIEHQETHLAGRDVVDVRWSGPDFSGLLLGFFMRRAS